MEERLLPSADLSKDSYMHRLASSLTALRDGFSLLHRAGTPSFVMYCDYRDAAEVLCCLGSDQLA